MLYSFAGSSLESGACDQFSVAICTARQHEAFAGSHPPLFLPRHELAAACHVTCAPTASRHGMRVIPTVKFTDTHGHCSILTHSLSRSSAHRGRRRNMTRKPPCLTSFYTCTSQQPVSPTDMLTLISAVPHGSDMLTEQARAAWGRWKAADGRKISCGGSGVAHAGGFLCTSSSTAARVRSGHFIHCSASPRDERTRRVIDGSALMTDPIEHAEMAARALLASPPTGPRLKS